MRQDVLEALLEEALRSQGVRVDWRNEVSRLAPGPDGVGVTVDKFEKESRGYVVAHTEWVISKSTEFDVPFVIGADGYNSRVRRALKIDFQEVGPAQYVAVFEFKTDADLEKEMRISVGGQTSGVLWPLPNGACRWSFEIPGYHDESLEGLQRGLLAAGFNFPTERSKERLFVSQGADSPLLSDGNLRAMIAEHAPWFTGQVGEVVWKSIVRFERRLAGSFGNGRMWLAGDAAHLTGPVGIQSMNIGLAEADDLARTIAGILRKGESASNLDAYSQRWTGVWRQLHNLDGGLQATPESDPWVAGLAAKLTSCLPAYGEELGVLAGRLGLALGRAAGA
jgi:2-polyprenyl-6-methoxyphenol hydroxylase-like FAD-dependent oxidoreductase